MQTYRLTILGSLLAAFAVAPGAHAQSPQNALVGYCTIDAVSTEKLTGSSMQAKCTPNVSIPYGKRWVIETASVWCAFDAGATPPAVSQIVLTGWVQVGVGTYQGNDFAFPEFASSTGSGLLNLPRRTTRANLRGPIYSEIPPNVQVERFSGVLPYAKCSVAISGYLIDKAVAF